MTTSLLNTMLGVVGPARLIDLDDVDAAGAITGDVLLRGPGSHWINYPLGTITSTFVPYSGAASNVNLGTNSLIAASILTDLVITENMYFNSVGYDVLICTSPTSGLITNVQMGNNLTFFEGELSVTNAALTRTNDTNVTLTLGGSPSSALLAATSLALGWTGTLAPSRGGTGTGAQTNNGICYYDGSKITTSSNATLSFIAGDVDLLITHPSVAGTAYEIVVTSSSCQYVMAYNTASTFQGICGTGATENYWTLSTAGLGLYVSASSLWFGSTSNNDMSFYRNNTERLRLTTTGIYVPDVAYLSAASPTINTMVSGTSLIQSSVRLISAYSGAASANSSYFLGSGNDGGLLQLFGAGGTIASPTALTTDSRMGGLFGRGYAATGYSNAVAGVTFHAESTFTDTSTPTYMVFATTASGATTRREVARFDSRGALLFASGLADGIGFTGSLGYYSIQYYNDGARYPLRFVGSSDAGTPRWFEFGNYSSDTYGGTWNAKVSINSVTGYTVAGSTVIGPWPIASTYALFGNSALDQTNAGNYSIVVRNNGEFNLNRPSGQNFYFREGNGGSEQFGIYTGGYVGVNTSSSTATRKLTVQGGAASNDQLFYLKQSNDYGYSFNLDSFSTGRLWIKGVNNGIETDIMTLDRTNAYVGIGTTSPSWRLVVNENAGYSSRAANPLPAQVAVQSGASGYLRLGNYYTGGVGTCSTIQSTDYFSGADHGCNLLLNPLGGNVGVGEDTPNFAMVARYTGTIAQISARYDGTSPSNHKELQIGYNGSSGSGYGWLQAIHNGSTYTNIVLNLSGGNIGMGGLATSTGGYNTRLDIYNGGTGPCIKIQESSGSGRGHIQIGASSTATNNVHIGCEGNGAFYVWNGVFGSGAQKFVVDASGNMSTNNTTTLNAYIATGVSGAYVQLGNSNSGGYSTQLIHSGIHSILQNGAGGALYFRAYTANYAAVVGEMILGQEGALYMANRASVPGTPGGGGYLYTESGALKYKGSSGTVTTIAPA